MNIGIFSGSFNPIHIGHLALANYIVEYTNVDEVWFLVTPQNPFKEQDSLLDENERLRMVEIALSTYPKMKASRFELGLPRPSYTVNTMRALTETYPEDTFTLIIGADNWENFSKWKDHEEILKSHAIMVYPRLGHRISIPQKSRTKVEALDSPIVEMSSTFIRESLEEGKSVRAFLPERVYDYIKEKGLYNEK